MNTYMGKLNWKILMIKRLFLSFHVLSLFFLASAIIVAQNKQSSQSNVQRLQIVPVVDHHQHVFSPAYAKLQSPDFKIVTAQDVIELLDKAGIRRAVLLSTGFRWGRPAAEPPDEYAGVKAENDWTGAQAALFQKGSSHFAALTRSKITRSMSLPVARKIRTCAAESRCISATRMCRWKIPSISRN
jgi:hypothetical protein